MREPDKINPAFKDDTASVSDCIVSAGIYQPIGGMRVGNSKHEYFIVPEVSGAPLLHDRENKQGDSSYRENTGALKRQAAKFHIYGLNVAGKVVKELTLENAEIKWTVHLANQKSSWYEFQIALDIPEAADAVLSLLRNNNTAERSDLLIKPYVSGADQSGDLLKFKGNFLGRSVCLGEMRTDEWIARLCNSSPAYCEMRLTISNNFRRYKEGGTAPQLWPWIYGDAMSSIPTGSVRQHETLSDLQLSFLDQWVDGDSDTEELRVEPARIEDLPIVDQPGMPDIGCNGILSC